MSAVSRQCEFKHVGRRYRAIGEPDTFTVAILVGDVWRLPKTKVSFGVLARAQKALQAVQCKGKTMTETDAKDLTAVLCNLHDRIAGLQATLEALPAKIAEAVAVAVKQPIPQAPAPAALPPKAAPKPAPWPDRLRAWLATPEAAKRLKDRTLTIAVLGNQLKHNFSPGERKALGRVLADEGLIRVAGAEGDYYIKDPL